MEARSKWRYTNIAGGSNLGEPESALACYRKIESPLPTPENEYARLFNHSLCLFQLGQVAEARIVFDSVSPGEWPEAMREHVENHRANLLSEDDPPTTH